MVCAYAEGSREGRGTVEALRKARRRRTRFRRELSFERSRDVGRRVKKSPRGGDFSPGEKERGTEREGRGRDSPPRGRARAFETRFSSPIHLFLSSTPIEKRCSRPALDVPKNGFLRWKGSLARWRKEIPFSDPRLVQSSDAVEERGGDRFLRCASSFQEFSWKLWEKKK